MSLVVIDPGHGGHEVRGRSTPFGERTGTAWEKDLNLRIAERVAAHLGSGAVLTRTGDHNLSLSERASFARRSAARAFVSIHGHNGADATDVFVHARADEPSRGLAHWIRSGVPGPAHARTADLAVLAPELLGAGTAGCLIEYGYPIDAARLLTGPSDLDQIGARLAAALRAFVSSDGDVGRPTPPMAAVAREPQRYGTPATISIVPGTTIAMTAATGWLSEHFVSVSTGGELSVSGHLTADGASGPVQVQLQVDARGLAAPVFFETLELTPGTPFMFARPVTLARPGAYRITFVVPTSQPPPSLVVSGRLFL